jgi:hypothetical protein
MIVPAMPKMKKQTSRHTEAYLTRSIFYLLMRFLRDNGYLNTGGKYNPVADSWTATSTINAPDSRELRTAVWTGD